jgi:hypothetical protein
MFNWLSENITLPYVLVLVAGLLLGYGINWGVCAWQERRHPGETVRVKRDGFITLVGIIIIIAMTWIMVSVDQARNCSIRLAVSQANENAANKMERDAFQLAITKSLSIPPELRGLPQNDPALRAYTDPITQEYQSKVGEANKLRQDNQDNASRAAKACGTT